MLKLTNVHATGDALIVDGVPCRRFEGRLPDGSTLHLLVHRVAVDPGDDTAGVDRELAKMPAAMAPVQLESAWVRPVL